MTDNFAQTRPPTDEPEDGWVSGPDLVDTQILTIALCKYTGTKPFDGEGVCTDRQMHLHPDVDCIALYYLGDALAAGLVSYEMPAQQVVAADGGEPTYRNPL